MDKIADLLDRVRESAPGLKPLEPIEAIPITNGVKMVAIDPAAKYIIFINDHAFGSQSDILQFIEDEHNPLPPRSPVYCIPGPIEDAIKIYTILDTKISNHA